MQAIILAAGYGRRLHPITEKMPKCLVSVNGIPLIVNALNALAFFNIDEVIIVVGHMKEKVVNAIGHAYKGMNLIYVENPDYLTTNNVYSLYLTKNYIKDEVILLECDLFYKENFLYTIINKRDDCSILVSPFNIKTMDGTVIEIDQNLRAKFLYINKHQSSDFNYEGMMKTVNIYKFSKAFIKNKFIPAIEEYINNHSKESYYELVLGSLIYYGESNINVVVVEENEWCEIDDSEDLMRAEKLFIEQ